jgi:hypothetical protein
MGRRLRGEDAMQTRNANLGLGELALLPSDFPLGGPVVIRRENKATLPLCKDREEGQRMKHIDVVHHFARDRGGKWRAVV